MKTLIIVDVQNDFTLGGALAVPDGDAIVPLINNMLAGDMPAGNRMPGGFPGEFAGGFDLVVATQDWHPPGHKSFASAHAGKAPLDVIDLNGQNQTLWPDHCVQGSAGAAFHPGLDTRPIEAIFRKGTDYQIDSYSGFYDNGHRKSTGLAGYLREKGAGELYFCGLAADICVYFTLLDALGEGFSATLIEAAVRPLDKAAWQKAKSDITSRGGIIL